MSIPEEEPISWDNDTWGKFEKSYAEKMLTIVHKDAGDKVIEAVEQCAALQRRLYEGWSKTEAKRVEEQLRIAFDGRSDATERAAMTNRYATELNDQDRTRGNDQSIEMVTKPQLEGSEASRRVLDAHCRGNNEDRPMTTEDIEKLELKLVNIDDSVSDESRWDELFRTWVKRGAFQNVDKTMLFIDDGREAITEALTAAGFKVIEEQRQIETKWTLKQVD